MPRPCPATQIHTYRSVPLPCSDSAVSFVKVRVVAGKIRTANPLRIVFAFMFKQTLNMETVRFVSTSDKCLTSYVRDEQRNGCRWSSCEMSNLVFNIKFHDNPFRGIRVILFIRTPHFSFLKVILKKSHLLLESPCGCLATGGLPPT